MRRLVPGFLSVLLLGGCPASDAGKSPASAKSGDPEAKPEPEPTVAPPSGERTAVPAVELLGPAPECPGLSEASSPGQAAAAAALAPLRELSCKPELLGSSTDEITRTLGVPDGITPIIGRRYMRVELPEPIALIDVLAVAGIADAKLEFERKMVSRWVVVDKNGERLRPWGVGLLDLAITYEGSEHDAPASGTVAEITAESKLQRSIGIHIPETALAFKPDPHAAAVVLESLEAIASDPKLLQREPEQAREVLAGLGERFELHRYSEGLGEQQVLGLLLRPHRTELVAAELATALGLPDARHESLPIFDANRDHMASGDQTEIAWKGLVLKITLDDREGTHLGLADWLVDEIEIMPGAAPK